MAVIVIHRDGPEVVFSGTLAQTPRSTSSRVGSYAEVVATGGDVEVVCADETTNETPSSIISSRGWIERDRLTAGNEDDAVRTRLEKHEPIFTHLFVVHDDYDKTFEDWLDVALVDGAVPKKESGWDLDGNSVHLYELATSMRDAVSLGKAQRSMEAVGGDTSVAQIVQRVHEEVEAPISLISEHIHGDEDYSLFRPGTIYQTMFSVLAENRHEQFDRSTHFAEINLTQS